MKKCTAGYLVAGKIWRGALLAVIVLLALSCATKSDAYTRVDEAVSQHNFEAAIEVIRDAQEGKKPLYSEKNSILLYLDKGFLEHYAGNYQISSDDLQNAERMIEEAFTKSVTEDIASYIANDNTKEYPGEDFEDIYINVFNALNYYKSGNTEGALVEVRKLTIPSGKLNMLAMKYEGAGKTAGDWMMQQLGKIGFTLSAALPQGEPVNFSNSALARYLSALFYLADRNTDGARIEFDQLQEAFNSNPTIYSHPVPSTVAQERSVPAGQARLNVIGFVGLSPIKEEGLFTQTWPFFQYRDLQSPIFKLPIMVDRPSVIDGIEITIKDEKFRLELLEDMGAVIKETFTARFNNMFFKTYIRVLLKYAAAEITARVAVDQGAPQLAAMAGIFAAKKGLDATEGADIRMSRYLPNKALVGGINVEPGTYDISISYLSGERVVSSETIDGVEVKAGALNLVDVINLK
ncbi:MAG: hypothetical protein LBU66_03935 [Treponema sp.]|jgi:hypothetical protein|nr:hypothetical protein [Treponema sp.]